MRFVPAAAATVALLLVTTEIYVRLLGDPGGRAVGGARGPEGEESISQVKSPEPQKVRTTFLNSHYYLIKKISENGFLQKPIN